MFLSLIETHKILVTYIAYIIFLNPPTYAFILYISTSNFNLYSSLKCIAGQQISPTPPFRSWHKIESYLNNNKPKLSLSHNFFPKVQPRAKNTIPDAEDSQSRPDYQRRRHPPCGCRETQCQIRGFWDSSIDTLSCSYISYRGCCTPSSTSSQQEFLSFSGS